jgi:hypothetical protein
MLECRPCGTRPGRKSLVIGVEPIGADDAQELSGPRAGAGVVSIAVISCALQPAATFVPDATVRRAGSMRGSSLSLSRSGYRFGRPAAVIPHVGCETQRVNSEELDRELDQVLIGGREKREIVIVQYDGRWPGRFEAERVRVQQALGTSAIRIEHIGSTAVPGLAAKSIIDVCVTVEDPDDETVTVPALTAAASDEEAAAWRRASTSRGAAACAHTPPRTGRPPDCCYP